MSADAAMPPPAPCHADAATLLMLADTLRFRHAILILPLMPLLPPLMALLMLMPRCHYAAATPPAPIRR